MFEKEKFNIIIQGGQSNAEGIGIGAVESEYQPLKNVLYLNTQKSRNDRRQNRYKLSWACGKTVELCNILGEFERAKHYREIITSLNQVIHSTFFDEDKKLYKTYMNKDEYSQLANALCVLCGACPSEYLDSIADKIAYRYDGWVNNTLSMNIFRFDALLSVNKEKYSGFILQEIDRIYGKMLQEGATSFWETEKGAEDFDGAGSLCHGWSAIPIYYYHILKIGTN